MMQNAGAEVNKNDPDADTQAKRFSVFGYEKAATFENWGVRSDTVNAGFVWHNYGDTAQAPYVNRRLRRDMIQVSEGSNWDNPTIMLNNPRLFVKNSLEGYHSNLQGINNTGFENWQPMKDAYGEWFETLARYTGYRFLMPTATYDTEVKPGGEFRISHTWTNSAVGFSPRRYPVEVRFTDKSTGNVVWRGTDATLDQTKLFKSDVRQINSAFTLPADLPAGSYDVAVAMLGEDGKPRIELAMPGGKDKVYPIGTVQVAAGAAQGRTADDPADTVHHPERGLHRGRRRLRRRDPARGRPRRALHGRGRRVRRVRQRRRARHRHLPGRIPGLLRGGQPPEVRGRRQGGDHRQGAGLRRLQHLQDLRTADPAHRGPPHDQAHPA